MSSLVSASPTSFQDSSQVKWRAKPVVRQLRELQYLPTLHCYCLQYTLYTAHSTLSHRVLLTMNIVLKLLCSTTQPKSTSNIWQCIIWWYPARHCIVVWVPEGAGHRSSEELIPAWSLSSRQVKRGQVPIVIIILNFWAEKVCGFGEYYPPPPFLIFF